MAGTSSKRASRKFGFSCCHGGAGTRHDSDLSGKNMDRIPTDIDRLPSHFIIGKDQRPLQPNLPASFGNVVCNSNAAAIASYGRLLCLHVLWLGGVVLVLTHESIK
jgi:hypothetical protein